ncbi:MAG TPA: HAD family hydrolase [Myxococcales bacterium]|jgi:3-deoxy-D-manno-octulosonate 8-phosphate phosphatase (KDO 8-P phosphatase)
MLEEIKAIALDVDGVLTDGTFVWGLDGGEYKSFAFLDVMGISRGKKAGLVFALISGEASPLVDRFAKKMGIVHVYAGCKDKAAALRDFAQKLQLDLRQVCMMGDDVNDVPAMGIAGFSAAPSTAHATALGKARLVTRRGGGQGAVRELIDHLLASPEQG